MPDKVLGLDIQKDTVNAVVVKAGFRNPQIIAHASIAMQVPEDDDQNAWELTLTELKKTVNIAGAIPVVAFPASDVSFRNIVVPFKDPKKIRQVLPFELEPLMIRPLDQGIIDFHIIEKGDPTRMIACIADMQIMLNFWEQVKQLDVEPEFVPVESVCTVLCLTDDTQLPDQFIFVDCQSTQSIIIYIDRRTIAFIRRIQYAESSDIAKILIRSMYHTQVYYLENVDADFKPEHLCITGACVDETMISQLSDEMELAVQEVNLVNRLSVKMDKEDTEKWNHRLMDNALAMAMVQNRGNTSFNLRQGPFAIKRRWQEYKNEIVNTVLWSILLALAFCSNMFIDNKILEKQNQILTNEVKTIFEQALPGVPITNPVQQMQEKIQTLKSSYMVPGDNQSTLSVIDTMNLISKLIADAIDVRLTRFVAEGSDIHISGTTDAFNSVDIIKNKLESAQQIQSVSVTSSKKERRGDKIVFKLKVILSESQL
ncbi:MAG: general secretion pathway protein L [Candidatus Magnetoglobus multicellularis str. Araruama]|uniref:General secretion pathway protein L n=1 Tax=Candidatus Magnetoglobus multicellularis str. Araruama TaxID=890399 RepID=A0A1V1PFP6_9BACT|nr:MAG: general secretion pathway protein L [Candidatus Magnetoglobus multicellularis str. Araruama]